MTAPSFTQPGGDQAPASGFAQPGNGPLEVLGDQLKQIIRDGAARAPRSVQTTMGPSEAGVECDRRLAFRLLNWPATNTGGDPLASIIGTGFHSWAADVFTRPEHRARWLVEQRLTIAPPYIPGGSCDLYDMQEDDVIDWKVVGATSMRKYKTEGPRQQYQVQGHLYGLGWQLAGRTPKTVTLAFIPRAGLLSGMWLWRTAYDPMVAANAIRRIYAIKDLILAVDPEAQPANWALIPAKADHGCTFCPWYRPGSADISKGCPGDLPPKT